MFIIVQNWNPLVKSILCANGEWHAERHVGPGAYAAKAWKTQAAAERYAAARWNHPDNANLKTGVLTHPVTIEGAL